MVAEPLTKERPSPNTREATSASAEWLTVVWDDPVNLMSYVTHVFQRHFGYSRERAHALMMKVHVEGRANVSRGQRERMEADVVAMHSYGLKATLEQVTGD
ncbi:MAG: ATP-dependent Clp protease adapter ClpS [Actinomycetaceae bacterium]|nr:ATP-dependent Clp protease adapter ClpS [Actinomycetaceae bacterium]